MDKPFCDRRVAAGTLLNRHVIFPLYKTMLTITVGLMAERSLYKIAHRRVQRGEALIDNTRKCPHGLQPLGKGMWLYHVVVLNGKKFATHYVSRDEIDATFRPRPSRMPEPIA